MREITPSTYISTLSAFVLAAAVIVTVSWVVGFCGLCEIVSLMLLFVVVVWFGMVWFGVPRAGTVKVFVPWSGSVSTPIGLLARPK